MFPTFPTQEGPYPGPTATNVEQPVGILPSASEYYNQGGPEPYPLYRHAYFNPLEQQGHQMQLMGAQQSVADAYGLRPILGDFYGAAIGSMTDTMRGDAGVPPQNPYGTGATNAAVDRMSDNILSNIMPKADLSAAGANQAGSSRHGVLQANALQSGQDAAARAAAELENANYNSWLGAWGKGQDQQSKAWSLVPGLFSGLESAYLNPSQMVTGMGGLYQGVGGQYRDMSNTYLGDQQALWNESQAQPYDNADWYSGILAKTPGVGKETTQLPDPSMLGNALGGAAIGYGLYNQFNSGSGGGGVISPETRWGAGNTLSPGGGFLGTF